MGTDNSSPLDAVSLTCPLDGLTLERSNGGFACAQNHTYDIARQGYVNLLPVQFKSSRDPGDSKSMVAARRAVLEQGHFHTLGKAYCNEVLVHIELPDSSNGYIVDAGCGEGYYTALLATELSVLHSRSSAKVAGGLLGIDISKWAIQAAAKKYSDIAFAVASNRKLPVPAGSVTVITSVFGFETWVPWAELQIPGQSVIVVDAGPHHLFELRQSIYTEVRVHEAPDDGNALKAGYEKTNTTAIKYTTRIESQDTLQYILEMTPHGHKANPELLNKLAKLDTMNLTIDAVIRSYRRR